MAQLPVDVIVTVGSPGTQAAQQATATIPIVMIGIGDPVRAGFCGEPCPSRGNITGNSILSSEVAAKRLQLLKLAVPTMSRVAFLWNPDNSSQAAYLDEWKAAAPALGVEILARNRLPGMYQLRENVRRKAPKRVALSAFQFLSDTGREVPL